MVDAIDADPSLSCPVTVVWIVYLVLLNVDVKKSSKITSPKEVVLTSKGLSVNVLTMIWSARIIPFTSKSYSGVVDPIPKRFVPGLYTNVSESIDIGDCPSI